MARSPIVAVVMMCIPLVNLYLFYKWFEEYKAATNASYTPIVQLILCFIPIVNLYIIWKFFCDVEASGKAKGSTGYPLGATVLYAICLVTMIFFGLGFLVLLFMFYKTQEMINLL